MLNEAPETLNIDATLQKTPVAIIGMASIFPKAENLEQYWDNIIREVDCITEVPPSRWNIDEYYDPDPKAADKTYCKRGGFIPDIDFNPMEFGLPPNILEVTDVSQLLSLIVAREAIKDAGYGEARDYNRARTGVILGVGGGQKLITPLTTRLQYPIWDKVLKSSGIPAEAREKIIEKMKLAYIPWEENSFPGMLGNVIAGRIANRLDLGGTNCVVDAACAASLAAVKMAISELLEHRADTMITGGVDTDNSIFMYMSFSKTPAFSRQQEIRPFDADSDGMMIGEGIGMLVLKRLADAERDNDRIYAVIRGIGSSSDGKYKSIYAPRSSGQALALTRAYQAAGFPPSSVGLIEAHGTGTPAGDPTEFAGLSEVFIQNNPKKQQIALGSVKSQIGHTKAAAGVASLIKTTLALHHKVLPPTLNVSKPNPKMDIENSPFYLNTKTRPWIRTEDAPPRRAGVSAFGFGGTNFHFVLEEYGEEHNQAYRLHPAPHTIFLSAPTPAQLLARCEEQLAWLESDGREQRYQALVDASQPETIAASSARIGFVASSSTEAAELLRTAITLLNKNGQATAWEHPKGIYYRQAGLETAGKVVALFPGQGSQYLEMGKDLAINFPPIRQAFSAIDALFVADKQDPLSGIVFPVPGFEPAEQTAQTKNLEQTKHAQPAIGTFSVGLYKLLQRAGFRPDFAAGHSFGELTALWAGGVISEDDYYFLIKARGEAMAPPADPNFDAGTMLAIKGDVEQIQSEVATLPEVTIANLNSYDQVVLAGSKAAMQQAQQQLEGKGYFVTPLPVSAAFHTPLVGHAQQPFAQAIARATFKSPTIPVYSNSTGQPYANNPESIQAILRDHILKPVLFQQEIENIYAAGGTIFVEIGPRRVLTNLVKSILGDRPHLAVALNASAKKDGDRQLREAFVQLCVAGLPLRAIDRYQAARELASDGKNSLMNVRLNGTNYVSEKTAAAFEAALQDGDRVVIAAGASASLDAATAPKPAVAAAASVKPQVNRDRPRTAAKPVSAPSAAAASTNAAPTIAPAAPPPARPASLAEKKPPVRPAPEQMPPHSPQADTTATRSTSQTNNNGHSGDNTNGSMKNSNKSQQNGKVPLSQPQQTINSLEHSLNLLHQHQAETLRVHETYLKNQEEYSKSVFSLMRQHYSDLPAEPTVDGQTQSTTVPIQETERSQPGAPPPTVDSQEPAQPPAKIAPPPAGVPVPVPAVPDIAPQSESAAPLNGAAVTAPVQSAPGSSSPTTPVPAPEPKPVPAPEPAAASPAVIEMAEAMLDIVSEKTGYPAEMLELDMDMEADLGIDSIKRVEILGAMEERYPNLPPVNPEELVDLRTLGEIVEHMQGQNGSGVTTAAPPAQPVAVAASESEPAPVPESQPAAVSEPAAAAPAVAEMAEAMLAVVSEKTGYPAEMLELEMDMEADLGIDSIKRVEILGAMEERYPNLPPVNPEELVDLRTLGEIVEHMQGQNGSGVTTAAPPAQPVAVAASESEPAPVPESQPAAVSEPATAAPAVAEMAEAMLAVVSEKTGYPAEMLELEMDMEADLGIDSIKRVEILGAMEERYPNLPPVNPEELVDLRTLGEIVEHMQGQNGSDVTTAAPPAQPVAVAASKSEPAPVPESQPAAVSEPATAAPAVAEMAEAMLAVVSEKTGYPAEMLELEMDMEADLGIDSIKRVEILGAMEERYPNLPPVNPEELVDLRTLGEIVEHMQGQNGSGVTTAAPTHEQARPPSPPNLAPPPSLPTSPATDELADMMLVVVSEKTGYPVEMLELGMDMEADLGIDSIKRVEILGAMEERYPEMPPVNPEELVELRTLGGIVDFLGKSEPAAVGAGTTANNNDTPTVLDHAISNTPVRLKPLPAPDFLEFTLPESHICLLTDDGTANTAAVAQTLTGRGWRVVVLTFPQTIIPNTLPLPAGVSRVTLESVSEAHLQQQLAAMAARFGPVGAFIHLNPPVAETETGVAKAILKQIFFIAKHLKDSLNQAARQGRSCFMTVVRLDGALGLSKERDFNPIQGGLFGLTKTLNLEWSQVFCRAVDLHPGIPPEQLGQYILAELHDPNRLVAEVGYGQQGRVTLAADGELAGEDSPAPIPDPKSNNQEPKSVTPSSLFVVSGGGKGITAQCAIRLAQQYRCKFILLGRSSIAGIDTSWVTAETDEAGLKRQIMDRLLAQGEKPTPAKVQNLARSITSKQEIEGTLHAIRQAGGQAEYLSVDVTDSAALKRELTKAELRLGAITGIIHGAGVLSDKLIEKKTEQDFEAVYSTKVEGLQALLANVPPQQLDHLVLFSSAAGFYGNTGQADYALANEILNKQAHLLKHRHPGCHVVSINWGPWDGGMVTPALKRIFAQRNIEVIPAEVGTAILASELDPSRHAVVQTVVGGPLSFPTDETETRPRSYRIHRFLSVEANPFLQDHVIGGQPVLPTVNAMAWMGNLCEQFYPGYTMFSCDKYQVLKGIVFDDEDDAAQQYALDLEQIKKDDDQVMLKAVIWSLSPIGKIRYHYRAEITLLSEVPEAPVYEAFDDTEREPISHEELYQGGALFHGPSFQGVERVLNISPQKLTMRCRLPHIPEAQQGQFQIQTFNPFIADGQYQSLVIWARHFYQAGSLPLQAGRGEQYRSIPFGETSYVSMEVKNSSDTKLVADIFAHDAEGKIYTQVLDAEVTISPQLNRLFVPATREGARQ